MESYLSSNSNAVDEIQKSIYTILRQYGFKKHGRTFHRFVDGDVSQVITFQLGQSYLDMNHLLFVNVGIRIPECMTHRFTPEENPKKYYKEYECNIRSRLGNVEGKEESCYDLHMAIEPIVEDILRQLRDVVLPVFEILSSRESILDHRREFPNFDLLNDHLILLEEAMIYGRRGDLKQAEESFDWYYRLFASGQLVQKDYRTIENHLKYLNELAGILGLPIPVMS